MAEDLQAGARDALASIASAIGTSAVTVIYDGVTVTGVQGVVRQETDAGDLGDLGITDNQVRVSSESISRPARGATLLVDGKKVFALRVRTDPAEAMYVIEYSEQQIHSD